MFKKATLIFCLASLATLVGCNKLTQENYNKLKANMDRSAVESIFGKPTECQNVTILMSSATNCTWQKGDASLKVQFIDNKVVTYFGNKIK